jgi:dihydrofolate reductase
MMPSAPDWGAVQDAIAGDVVLPRSIHKNAAIHGADASIGGTVARPPPERGPRPSSPGAPGSLGAVAAGIAVGASSAGAKMADTEADEMQRRAKEIAMRKVVVSEFLSVDGVMEDPGGAEQFEHGGWTFQFDRGPEGDKFKLDELLASDALLLGRVTYEGFAAAWPTMTDEVGFADKMNSMPKYVVSTTLEEPLEWNNSTLIRGNVAEEVSKLKQEQGGDILINGSGELVHTLMEHDLIDEYRLMVFPVVLGSGKRLFRDGSHTTALKRVDTKTVGSGVLILTYQPAQGE